MKILMLLFFIPFMSFSQVRFLEHCIDGDWVLNYNYWSYDGAGTGKTKYLDNFDKFIILSFNSKDNSFKIRDMNKIIKQGTFKLIFENSEYEEKVMINLGNNNSTNRFSMDEFDYFILTTNLKIVSKGYMPGFCADWDNYDRVGRGFFDMKLNSKNKNLIRKLVSEGQQIWWHEKDLKKEETLLTN